VAAVLRISSESTPVFVGKKTREKNNVAIIGRSVSVCVCEPWVGGGCYNIVSG